METSPHTILNMCRRTDYMLWEAYLRSQGILFDHGTGRLEFTLTRDDKLRVSEQEARFAFVEALCQKAHRYSIEIPTTKTYNFSGRSENARSGQTDIQARDKNGRGFCNVEFKAKGVSNKANCDAKAKIFKDIQKLMREPVWGLWFHLLEGVNKSTIPKLLEVIGGQIGRVGRCFRDIDSPGLTIHVCVLRQRFSLSKSIPINLNETELAEHLYIKYLVSRQKLIEIQDSNGWNLTRGFK